MKCVRKICSLTSSAKKETQFQGTMDVHKEMLRIMWKNMTVHTLSIYVLL